MAREFNEQVWQQLAAEQSVLRSRIEERLAKQDALDVAWQEQAAVQNQMDTANGNVRVAQDDLAAARTAETEQLAVVKAKEDELVAQGL